MVGVPMYAYFFLCIGMYSCEQLMLWYLLNYSAYTICNRVITQVLIILQWCGDVNDTVCCAYLRVVDTWSNSKFWKDFVQLGLAFTRKQLVWACRSMLWQPYYYITNQSPWCVFVDASSLHIYGSVTNQLPWWQWYITYSQEGTQSNITTPQITNSTHFQLLFWLLYHPVCTIICTPMV